MHIYNFKTYALTPLVNVTNVQMSVYPITDIGNSYY